MIIFLYGPDSFRAKEKLKILKERFIREVDKSGFNVVEVDGERASINDLNKALFTQSFLAKKRLIIIKNIFKQAKAWQTEFLRLLKKGNFINEKDEGNAVIFLEEEPDKKSALFQYLAKSKVKENFQELKGAEIEKWIIARVKGAGATIERQAAMILASRFDNNLWSITNEIDKLAAGKRGGNITVEEVKETGLVKIDDNIFNITDAIANQNKKQALCLLEDNLAAGMNEIYLLSMIARQYRIIIQVKAGLEEQGGGNRELAKFLGLHPFVVQKALGQASRYSMDKLRMIYGKILETDIKLKSTDIAPRVLIEMLVAEI